MRRIRILISAYACGPGMGSEPGAGWQFARAAAERHDVWVITRERFREVITQQLAADPDLSRRMNPIYLELPAWLLTRKRRPRDVYWYYALWQAKARRVAGELHDRTPFDVAHHLTFASDWLPCGIAGIPGIPLIWGPVGGSTNTPWRMMRWMSPKDAVTDSIRSLATGLARRVWGDRVARRAALVVAQNPDVARRFAFARRLVTEPNVAVEPVAPKAAPDQLNGRGGERTALFVGRLTDFKGLRLAVAAVAHPLAGRWRLEVIGEGPAQRGAQRLAVRLGAQDRITWRGQLPRQEVLAALQRAEVLLFPSFHDGAGWAVAEAVSCGCPVICLDHGGPPLVAGPHGVAVPVSSSTFLDLVAALSRPPERFQPSARWSEKRLPDLVDGWYRQVLAP